MHLILTGSVVLLVIAAGAHEQQPQLDLDGDEPKKTRGRGSRKGTAKEPKAAKTPRAAKKSAGAAKRARMEPSPAPSVSATCSANSLVLCQINDWNAASGASRVWRTINGSAETDAASHPERTRPLSERAPSASPRKASASSLSSPEIS